MSVPNVPGGFGPAGSPSVEPPAPSAPPSAVRVASRVFGRLAGEPVTPRLRVFTGEVVVHGMAGLSEAYETVEVPLLALTFDYGAYGVFVPGDPADDELLPPAPWRDVDIEMAARRALEGLGAMDLACLEHVAAPPELGANYVLRVDATVHDWCTFAAQAVPQLKKRGFVVSVDRDHKFAVIEADPTFYAHVGPSEDEERPDWFGLELGIELDGRRVNLLPALLDLLEKTGSGDGLAHLTRRAGRCIAVPVGEGLFLPVPAERIRGILRVVAELYEGVWATPERLVFPPSRSSALERLDEVFQEGGGEAEWQDTVGARARAQSIARAASAPLDIEPPKGLKAELRPYQREGVAWLQHLVRSGMGGVLADDMGLGKTLQTITHLLLEKERGELQEPALIVAPTSLVYNWAREIRKFAPDLRVVEVHGPNRKKLWDAARECDVVVTSYPVLCRDEEHFGDRHFHLMVLDEAQTIKNDKSRNHQAVRSVSSTHRLCLSGTPVENHLGELWSLVDFLNPGLLGDELHFGRFFRVPIEKQKNEERLATLRQMLAPYILRRVKADVAKDLPSKTELLKPVEIKGTQRELYESIRLSAHAEVRKLIKTKGLAASTVPIFAALTKLRQACCDPRLVGLKASSQVQESAKLARFLELVTSALGGGHRVLVFSQFTSMLALLDEGLTALGVRTVALTGSTADRQKVCDHFESGQADVFLISLKAGGTGLTLTSADTVIHYDPWWNPAIQAQATDRAYRIGQKRPVMVHHLYVAGSVEERILWLQKKKKHIADAILGMGEAQSGFTEEDLDVLLAPLGA